MLAVMRHLRVPFRRWACLECAKLLERCANRPAMTNGDKIRAMTDEELSAKICNIVNDDCDECPALAVCCDDNGRNCEQEIEYWLKRKANE